MAKDGISFNDYINNPTGKGSSAVTNQKMYKQMYTTKFDQLMVRENGKVEYTVYKDKHSRNDSYYIHIKIPSEELTGFYYDTVIHLSTVEQTKKANIDLRQYQVKFFSNDQAFVYTFAYAFNKNKLFIDDLKPRMSQIALTKPAKVRNPENQVFYVKTFYFAYIVMDRNKLFNRIVLDNLAKPYSKAAILSKVKSSDDKTKEMEELREVQKKKRADGKRKQAIDYDNNRNTDIKTKTSSITKTVSKTSTISKNTKTTKKSKIIGAKK